MLEILQDFKLKPNHILLMNIPPTRETYGPYPEPGDVLDIEDIQKIDIYTMNSILGNALINKKLVGLLWGLSSTQSEIYELQNTLRTDIDESRYHQIYYAIMANDSNVSEYMLYKVDNTTKSIVEFTKGTIVAVSDNPFEVSEFISKYAPHNTQRLRKFKIDIDSSHSIQNSGMNGILISRNFAQQTSGDYSIQCSEFSSSQTSNNNCIQITNSTSQQTGKHDCTQIGKDYVTQNACNDSLQYAHHHSLQIGHLTCIQIVENGYTSQETMGDSIQINHSGGHVQQISGDGTIQHAHYDSTQRTKNTSLQNGGERCTQYSEDLSLQVCSRSSSQFTNSRSIQIASDICGKGFPINNTQIGKDECKQIGGIDVIQIAGDDSLQEGIYGAIQCAGKNSIQITNGGGCSYQKAGIGSIQIYHDKYHGTKHCNIIDNKNANHWQRVENGIWRNCNDIELNMIEKKYRHAMNLYKEEKEKYDTDFDVISKKTF